MKKRDYGFICDVGGKGKGNQDSALFNEFNMIIAPGSPDSKEFAYKCILSLVCDGVSASNHGEKGSSFVIRVLGSKIMSFLMLDNFDPSLVAEKLKAAIEETNNELLSKYKKFVDVGKVPKTTLVGLLIIGQYLWVFNLGDSRAFLLKDQLIGQISIDHVGTGAAHEITEAMGQSPINPAINFYNWAYENDQTATQKAFNENYYALICSDGLTDVVNSEEIKAYLMDENMSSLQQKVKRLYDLTMDRGIDDNVSIIAIDLADYLSNISKVQILKLSRQK